MSYSTTGPFQCYGFLSDLSVVLKLSFGLKGKVRCREVRSAESVVSGFTVLLQSLYDEKMLFKPWINCLENCVLFRAQTSECSHFGNIQKIVKF